MLAIGAGVFVGFGLPGLASGTPLVTTTPGVADGVIPAGHPATLEDVSLPAISRLDEGLLSALRRADAAAEAHGIRILISSGWRSTQYQRWLFAQAVKTYGSDSVAREYVASPDRSSHVTGRAVDVAPVAAQEWLIAHGALFGLCQIYANERWHFELATTPGGQCPPVRQDAAG